MKRIFLILILALYPVITFAQTMWFRTTEYASHYVNAYGYWTEWTDWQSSDMNVKMDLDNDIIVVYSPKTQIYKVVAAMDPPYDSSGQQVKFKVIDQDYDIGFVRLRIQNNGTSQIYIDFANIAWVYNVIRTQ